MHEQIVTLLRDNLSRPWGFRLMQKKDAKPGIMSIQRVSSGSPAEGKLFKEDIVTNVDGQTIENLSFKAVMDLVRISGFTLTLNILRNKFSGLQPSSSETWGKSDSKVFENSRLQARASFRDNRQVSPMFGSDKISTTKDDSTPFPILNVVKIPIQHPQNQHSTDDGSRRDGTVTVVSRATVNATPAENDIASKQHQINIAKFEITCVKNLGAPAAVPARSVSPFGSSLGKGGGDKSKYDWESSSVSNYSIDINPPRRYNSVSCLYIGGGGGTPADQGFQAMDSQNSNILSTPRLKPAYSQQCLSQHRPPPQGFSYSVHTSVNVRAKPQFQPQTVYYSSSDIYTATQREVANQEWQQRGGNVDMRSTGLSNVWRQNAHYRQSAPNPASSLSTPQSWHSQQYTTRPISAAPKFNTLRFDHSASVDRDVTPSRIFPVLSNNLAYAQSTLPHSAMRNSYSTNDSYSSLPRQTRFSDHAPKEIPTHSNTNQVVKTIAINSPQTQQKSVNFIQDSPPTAAASHNTINKVAIPLNKPSPRSAIYKRSVVKNAISVFEQRQPTQSPLTGGSSAAFCYNSQSLPKNFQLSQASAAAYGNYNYKTPNQISGYVSSPGVSSLGPGSNF